MLDENVNDNSEKNSDDRTGIDRRQDERRRSEDEHSGEEKRSDKARRSWVGRRQASQWRRR